MRPVRPAPDWPQGQVIRLPHRSRILAGNPWGDPFERELCVYLPPGYDEASAPCTALWDFAAFTNSGPGHLNWRNHGENLAQRLDRLIGEASLPPLVVAMPDCYTSLGGNQYLNSAGLGRYADYLLEELLPLLADRVHVRGDRAGRGAFGKSSGGYGVLYHAMHYPEFWGAVAAHAADCGFDNVYRNALPVACRTLEGHSGDIDRFLEYFWAARQPDGKDFTTLMVIAMAASYDPDPEAPRRVRLPFTARTCELLPRRWARWLEHDPLHMVDDAADALQAMRLVYLDVGQRDQYHIQFGMRALADRLEKLGVRHHFEEFDGTHSHIDWRLDVSLPMLAGALTAPNGATGGTELD